MASDWPAQWIIEEALDRMGFDSNEIKDLLKRFIEESKDAP